MSFDAAAPRTRVARFVPLRTDDLRPGLADHIGKVFTFEYGGTHGDDEPFPGQRIWLFARKHDEDLGPANAARWVPDQDLQTVERDRKD